MDDKEAQNDEILALESILEEDQFHITSNDLQTMGRILVKPEIANNLAVQLSRDHQVFKTQIEHLPPFELHFNFPADYPSANPPTFTLVCKWLKREQVIFTHFIILYTQLTRNSFITDFQALSEA